MYGLWGGQGCRTYRRRRPCRWRDRLEFGGCARVLMVLYRYIYRGFRDCPSSAENVLHVHQMSAQCPECSTIQKYTQYDPRNPGIDEANRTRDIQVLRHGEQFWRK